MKWPILNIDIFWFIMWLMFVFVIFWKIVKRVMGGGNLSCGNGGDSRCYSINCAGESWAGAPWGVEAVRSSLKHFEAF